MKTNDLEWLKTLQVDDSVIVENVSYWNSARPEDIGKILRRTAGGNLVVQAENDRHPSIFNADTGRERAKEGARWLRKHTPEDEKRIRDTAAHRRLVDKLRHLRWDLQSLDTLRAVDQLIKDRSQAGQSKAPENATLISPPMT